MYSRFKGTLFTRFQLEHKTKTFAPKEELADQDRQLKKEQTNQDCGNSMVVGVVLHVTVVLYALLLLA